MGIETTWYDAQRRIMKVVFQNPWRIGYNAVHRETSGELAPWTLSLPNTPIVKFTSC